MQNRHTLAKRVRQHWQLYVFLILPVVWVLIFKYYPMIGAQIAFKDFNIAKGVWDSEWVGLYHFKKFLNAYQFKRVIKNTIVLSVYSILAAFPFPILFALGVNVMRGKRSKKLVQTLTYMPHFISTVVLVGMTMQLFHPTVGVYGAVMKALTGHTPRDLFSNVNAFPHLYVWSGVWQSFGYNSIIYLAALTSVSEELHEAAQIDGASRFQRVMHVDIPAIVPTIIIMLILRMGHVMSLGFEKIYLMQNTLNLRVSEVISTFVYKQGIGSGASNDYSYATAIGLFNSLINLVLIVCVNAVSRRVSDTSLW